jgi:hypothetical protein
LKKLTALLLSGWLGWINTARWDEVSDPKEDAPAVQVSTQTASDQDERPAPQKESHAPQLRDILLGPPAPLWRDIRRDSFKER